MNIQTNYFKCYNQNLVYILREKNEILPQLYVPIYFKCWDFIEAFIREDFYYHISR